MGQTYAMDEKTLQIAVADYLARRYPDVLFHSDYGSGVKLTAGQARIQYRQNAGRRGWPDIFIAEPRQGKDDFYSGLFLELKADGVRLKKKNGDWATAHIAEQAEVLKQLRGVGYCAEFAVGFDSALRKIDEYMSL